MSSSDGSTVSATRRKQPRKGHTKSRKGCLTCKRRRVKCQETLPECGNCQRLGLTCQYPNVTRTLTVTPSPSPALQSTPTQFSMDDLRFFHHFLLFAYPGLPLRGQDVWQEVAKLSHSVSHSKPRRHVLTRQYEFLMHAMLGLAASHLTVCMGGNHSIKALSHRVKAVRLLNSAPALNLIENDKSSRASWSIAEGDARFATTMALAFQASYLADGMDEFLWMIRGCFFLSSHAMKLEDSAFRSFSAEYHAQAVTNSNVNRTRPENDELIGALESVRALRPLCKSTLQVKHLAGLERIAKTSQTSYVDGKCSLEL